MKTFLSLFLALFLIGCHHNPTVVPVSQLVCGKDLKPEAFESCEVPKNLPPGAIFEDSLSSVAVTRKALRDCSTKAKLLQDTIKACQRAAN